MEEIKQLAKELANTILYKGKNPLPDNIIEDNAKYLIDLIDGTLPEPEIDPLEDAKKQALIQAKSALIAKQAQDEVVEQIKDLTPEEAIEVIDEELNKTEAIIQRAKDEA